MKFKILVFLFLGCLSTPALAAESHYEHRFGFGFGIARHGDPAATDAVLTTEYEYRFLPTLGTGLMAQYMFSTPSETRLAIPAAYFHPVANNWILFGAPLFLFRSGSTYAGVRLGTRVLIPLGPLRILPSVAVDFVESRQDLFFGLGIEI